MKNFGKSILFIIIFVFIYITLSYLFLPKENLAKYGMYNTSLYEVLGEKRNTIDTLVVGDSLVYSSISPMEVYNEYGFTMFDCAEAAFLLSDAYDYLKIAADAQNPKIILVEANMFFRNADKKPWYDRPIKVLKNSLPLVTYHNNWKKMLFLNNKVNSWTNVSKGYKKNTNVKSSSNFDYMQNNKKKQVIPEANYEYIDKIVSYCKQNNIKLIFLGLPSQKSWNYQKHLIVEELANKYNVTYLNLNFNDVVPIDWTKETKDHGDHLNYLGAKKVSSYIGSYLKSFDILPNHQHEKGYEEWDRAVKFYMNN